MTLARLLRERSRLSSLGESGDWRGLEVVGGSAIAQSDELHSIIDLGYGKDVYTKKCMMSMEPERSLYLAVPVDVYQTFFQFEFTQIAVQRYQVLIVVYDPANEVIVQWTK